LVGPLSAVVATACELWNVGMRCNLLHNKCGSEIGRVNVKVNGKMSHI